MSLTSNETEQVIHRHAGRIDANAFVYRVLGPIVVVVGVLMKQAYLSSLRGDPNTLVGAAGDALVILGSVTFGAALVAHLLSANVPRPAKSSE